MTFNSYYSVNIFTSSRNTTHLVTLKIYILFHAAADSFYVNPPFFFPFDHFISYRTDFSSVQTQNINWSKYLLNCQHVKTPVTISLWRRQMIIYLHDNDRYYVMNFTNPPGKLTMEPELLHVPIVDTGLYSRVAVELDPPR